MSNNSNDTILHVVWVYHYYLLCPININNSKKNITKEGRIEKKQQQEQQEIHKRLKYKKDRNISCLRYHFSTEVRDN